MLPKFDAKKVWEIFLDMDDSSHNDDVSVFMAVPTIYAKLVQEYHNMGDKLDHIDVKQKIMSKIRLMVSGSAHMPDVSRNIYIFILLYIVGGIINNAMKNVIKYFPLL